MKSFGATVVRAARRFMSSLPALFGVLVFTFLLMRVLPGDPAVFFASGPNAGKEEIETIRKQMGLNKPVPEQLMLYLYDVGRGNLGRSMMTGQLVTKDLRERLPASLELTFTALLIALVSAVPLGVLAALKPGSVIDHSVRLFCALGVCVPTFVSGLLLIYVFYYLLGLAPDPTGRVDIFASLPPSRTGFLLIVFLGDTVNTTARIQELCRETGDRVLASADLIDRLELPPGVAKRSLGDLRLRGKGADLALYALTSAPQRAPRAEAGLSRDAAPEETRLALP